MSFLSTDVALGLDLGTTNCKVLALDVNGRTIAVASSPTPLRRTESAAGECAEEFDANELWVATARLIREVVDAIGPNRRVAGLAVSSLAESGALLDTSGRPLTSIIPWYDTRTLSWLPWWRERIADSDTFALTGLVPRHIYSAYRLLWYAEHCPQAFAQARTWLCVADWVTYCLTGELSTSYPMASRTLLFDVRRRAWSPELLRLAGLPQSLLPPAYPSGEIVGRVSREAAEATGLPEGIPVAAGGHDHLCAALAAGVIQPGPMLDSAGTAEPMMVALDAPALDASVAASGFTCGCHTARNRYYLLGGIMSGGVVNWLGRTLIGDDSPAAINQLMQIAAGSPPGAHGLWFDPYLDGSAPPERDAEAWGAWLGLRLKHTRADMVRSAMEGLTYALRQVFEGMQKAAGFPASELRVVGGSSRNAWWQALKADVFGAPVSTLTIADVAAQGAALLAGLAAGMYRDEDEAIACVYHPAVCYQPDPELHALYSAAYRRVFGGFYPALKALPLA